MKILEYYRHDADSHEHWQSKLLRKRYGWEGEGKFWVLKNIVATLDKCKLDTNDSDSMQSIARTLEMDNEALTEYIGYLSFCRLLEFKDGIVEFEDLRRAYIVKHRILFDRINSTNPSLWKSIINRVFQRDQYTCQYCGDRGVKLECDHIIPISKGGTNEDSNLTASCVRCNRQKRDKTVAEYKIWRNEKGLNNPIIL